MVRELEQPILAGPGPTLRAACRGDLHIHSTWSDGSQCLFAPPDAHAVDQLWYADTAMAHAAHAGIPADRIVSTWTLDGLAAWADRPQRG